MKIVNISNRRQEKGIQRATLRYTRTSKQNFRFSPRGIRGIDRPRNRWGTETWRTFPVPWN